MTTISEPKLTNNVKDIARDAKDTVKDTVKEQTEVAKESGKDWVKYVTSHPIQSIAFGVTIGLAVRGLCK